MHHSQTSNFEEKPELSLAMSERKDDLHSLGVISIKSLDGTTGNFELQSRACRGNYEASEGAGSLPFYSAVDGFKSWKVLIHKTTKGSTLEIKQKFVRTLDDLIRQCKTVSATT